jgi:hypothetical protein
MGCAECGRRSPADPFGDGSVLVCALCALRGVVSVIHLQVDDLAGLDDPEFFDVVFRGKPPSAVR